MCSWQGANYDSDDSYEFFSCLRLVTAMACCALCALALVLNVARQAARQYQSYDAFARVSMAFGTHQLMQSPDAKSGNLCNILSWWHPKCMGALFASCVILGFAIIALAMLLCRKLPQRSKTDLHQWFSSIWLILGACRMAHLGHLLECSGKHVCGGMQERFRSLTR